MGWEKAHHPWSKNGHTYSAVELLDHLVTTVIPLEKTEIVPLEAPIDLSRVPDMLQLGTKLSGVELFYKKQAESEDKLKLKRLRQREQDSSAPCGNPGTTTRLPCSETERSTKDSD